VDPQEPRSRDRIARVTLDEKSVVRRNAEVEHERAVAIYDLIEENRFSLVNGPAGPYGLWLSIAENRLVLDIRGEADEPLFKVVLSLSPFRKIVRDYFSVCESYYEAIKRASPSQIEAIDMGRRGLHDEGAELLRDRLDGKIDLDPNTARRLFTLVCVLHIRG
jgi:uncharacterized protein (UPF0262 family)